jgi:hypothetical protein
MNLNDRDERRNELYGGQKMKPYSSAVVTAEGARERAINASKIKAEEELRPVFSEIIKASTDGKFKVEYGKRLSDFAIMRLGELGYVLNAIDAENFGLGYIISWEVKLPG